MTKVTTENVILAAAAKLLEREGPPGVTTRAVCAAAKITAPTLYHHFGDKDGLLDALIARGAQEFLAAKHGTAPSADALVDLRGGWDRFVAFALERPRLFSLMVERATKNPEMAEGVHGVMRERFERLRAAGRLRTDVEFATRALEAAAGGVMTMFSQGASREEIVATSAFLFDAVLARLTRAPSPRGS
jgi:AcrR family transcriptional regulator